MCEVQADCGGVGFFCCCCYRLSFKSFCDSKRRVLKFTDYLLNQHLSHINLFNSHNTANYALLLTVMEVKISEVEELAQVGGQTGEGRFQAWDRLSIVVCFDEEGRDCYC